MGSVEADRGGVTGGFGCVWGVSEWRRFGRYIWVDGGRLGIECRAGGERAIEAGRGGGWVGGCGRLDSAWEAEAGAEGIGCRPLGFGLFPASLFFEGRKNSIVAGPLSPATRTPRHATVVADQVRVSVPSHKPRLELEAVARSNHPVVAMALSWHALLPVSAQPEMMMRHS